MNSNEILSLWKQSIKSKKLQKELSMLDENQIVERFSSYLEFGTAGLRGKIGIGSSFLNEYTVKLATNAVAEYVLSTKPKNPTIIVGYDTRKYSKQFAKFTSKILLNKGINVYLAKRVIPSPFVSYLVKKMSASAGIMITASHNPKEYNGYKVFDNRGCQIDTKTASDISKRMKKLNIFDTYQNQSTQNGTLRYIDNLLKNNFLKDLSSVQVLKKTSDVKIIYSPLNGTGAKFVPKILKMNGYKDIKIPISQGFASSNFKTCPYPNPEELQTYNESLKLTKNYNADIIILTDPDADRLGCMVKTENNYAFVNGNQIGLLMLQYLLENKQTKNGFVVSSIVSSPMVEKMAKKYFVDCYLTLTGFKNIAKKVDDVLKTNKKFIFAFEESNGYMPTTYTLDKDGISASLLLVEMVSFYKSKNKTLYDMLKLMENQTDYAFEARKYILLDGMVGKNKIEEATNKLRNEKPKTLNGEKITKVVDYLSGNVETEKSNIISIETEKNSKIIIRPSGTEPKLKFYSFASTQQKAEKQIDEMIQYLKLN